MDLLVIPDPTTTTASTSLDSPEEERENKKETGGPSTSKKVVDEASGRGILHDYGRGNVDGRGTVVGNARGGGAGRGRGRGRGRGGKGRTLFAVDIGKDPEAEDEEGPAAIQEENGVGAVPPGKATNEEEGKGKEEQARKEDMDLPMLRSKESIESMVFMGGEGE
jgi:hypothetical protein